MCPDPWSASAGPQPPAEMSFPLAAPADHVRSCAREHQHARTSRESSVQRDLDVAQNKQSAVHPGADRLAQPIRHQRNRLPGGSDAGAGKDSIEMPVRAESSASADSRLWQAVVASTRMRLMVPVRTRANSRVSSAST